MDTSSLNKSLSSGSKIDYPATPPPRLSDYWAPKPVAVIHPATEKDVQETVKWAVDHNIPFLVYGGGNGWATSFKLGENGILIQLDQLRDVKFNSEGTEVSIGGGALISDVVTAASNNSALVTTGICNTVGMLGALLGGGAGNLMGQYGLGVDELISLNVVDAFGKVYTVTPADESLWYAMRGAGPNFAVVTSAVMRAHPVQSADLQAWTGALVFRPDQLESVIEATNNLHFSPEMAVTLLFVNNPANASQMIIFKAFYHGSAESGSRAFKDLLDIGPVGNMTAMIPYTNWNDAADVACVKGGRRPTWGVGLAQMNPKSWRQVYDIWAEIIKVAGAERSSVVMNAYPTDKARSMPETGSAVPWRHTVKFHACVTVWYTDPAFDATAIQYGQRIRALWRETDGLSQPQVYINNAFGDEDLKTLYGNSLERLKEAKKTHDPSNRFNQWLPLA